MDFFHLKGMIKLAAVSYDNAGSIQEDALFNEEIPMSQKLYTTFPGYDAEIYHATKLKDFGTNFSIICTLAPHPESSIMCDEWHSLFMGPILEEGGRLKRIVGCGFCHGLLDIRNASLHAFRHVKDKSNIYIFFGNFESSLDKLSCVIRLCEDDPTKEFAYTQFAVPMEFVLSKYFRFNNSLGPLFESVGSPSLGLKSLLLKYMPEEELYKLMYNECSFVKGDTSSLL